MPLIKRDNLFITCYFSVNRLQDLLSLVFSRKQRLIIAGWGAEFLRCGTYYHWWVVTCYYQFKRLTEDYARSFACWTFLVGF